MAFVGMSAAFSVQQVLLPGSKLGSTLLFQFSFWTVTAVWMKKHNPELLKDRMAFLKRSAKGWDKIIIVTSTAVFVPYLLLPGLDASPIPMVIGSAGHRGPWLCGSPCRTAPDGLGHTSKCIPVPLCGGSKGKRPQSDHLRAIPVCPSSYVRESDHSLYSIPVALGSLWTLIPASALTLLFVIRTYFEDQTLHKELEGYNSYSTKVKYRLLPGVW